jgi:hypothetical protein
MDGIVIVVCGVVGGLLAFSLTLLFGTWLVKRLALPQDLPEGARYSPPAPPIDYAPEPTRAKATAALQARRAALFARIHALPEGARAAGDALLATCDLDPAALDRAEAALVELEAR